MYYKRLHMLEKSQYELLLNVTFEDKPRRRKWPLKQGLVGSIKGAAPKKSICATRTLRLKFKALEY